MTKLAYVLVLCTLCSADVKDLEREQIKRLEHFSNLALLTRAHLGTNKLVDNLSPNPATAAPVNPPTGTIQATYNPGGQPQDLPPVPNQPPTNELTFSYAPQTVSLVNTPTGSFENAFTLPSNYLQLPYDAFGTVGLEDGTNIVNSNGILQSNQAYQFQPAPQPYPANYVKTVQVPVHVRVPVEVPKPYEVRVPHPVPVPVHIRVPVPVDRPYPVQVTKTVAVPVEKPVYIKVPQPVEVPVPQPYPVSVPQTVQIKVPVVVRIADRLGNALNSELVNLDGTQFVPTAHLAPLNVSPPVQMGISNAVLSPEPSAATNSSENATKAPVSPVNLPPITGNGLLPPLPPATTERPTISSVLGGLINSYVASKEGGTYRRQISKYQTAEYHKTW